jgi:hypothetical protein
MLPPLPPFLRRHGFALVFTVLLAGCFLLHAHYRQRYIGAVDWYGYYQEGLLFKAGRTTLPTELPAATFPSVVPFGFSVLADGRVVPQYPPGFPLLLAAASIFGLEFHLMPLIGLVSCLVLFQLIRDLTGDRVTAALYAVLWAFFPIVVYGSTTIMSDLVAALFVGVSYLLYRRGRVFWSAFALTFALCVRPTNALYLPVFAVVLLRDRRLIRYGLGLLLPGVLYGFYNYSLYGAPWRTGYFDILPDLVAGVFVPHLGFYLGQILLQFSPLVLLLCVWGFRQPWGEKIFFVAWFAVFLLFYCFWRSGGDAWWYTRFLLPGFTPVFLLSALGFHRVRTLIEERLAAGPRRRAAQIALFVLVGVTPVYYFKFGLDQHDLWSTNKGYAYYEIVKETEKTVPPGSYVGSVEFAGSFRLYTSLGSYVSVHDNSPKLVDYVQARGHEAFLIVEPWNQTNQVVKQLLRHFAAVKVRDIAVWGGKPLPLYRLHAPTTP